MTENNFNFLHECGVLVTLFWGGGIPSKFKLCFSPFYESVWSVWVTKEHIEENEVVECH